MTETSLFSTGITSFALIALAEIGDKSQLVCMTLALRHHHWPVLFGSFLAFILLNTLAVLFGAGVAAMLPEQITALLVAVLFAVFGIHALRSNEEDDEDCVKTQSSRGVFMTAFILIMLSEFGDKTQIAVAGLAGGWSPIPIWIGATLALMTTSALGVWAGSTLLRRLPVAILHRLSGGLFLAFALIALWKALTTA